MDLLAADVRRDDLYVGGGVPRARASLPSFDKVLEALHPGDTLATTTLDRLSRSTQDMLRFGVVQKGFEGARSGIVSSNPAEGTSTRPRR